MIAYLIHTGVGSNHRIGWMWIAGSGGTRYHPSYMGRMGRNERWMMLFGPKVFKVGASGNGCVSVGIHVCEVGKKKTIDKGNSKAR